MSSSWKPFLQIFWSLTFLFSTPQQHSENTKKNSTTKTTTNEQCPQQKPPIEEQTQTPKIPINTQKTLAEEPTIIPETKPLPATQQQDEIFTSLSVITNNRYQLLQNIPNPQDIITPETTPTTNESDNDNPTPTSVNQNLTEKISENTEIPQTPTEDRLFKAKKLATQLETTSFWGVGNLNNATKDERTKIIALSMYYRLGTFDPSNEYTEKYQDKNVLDKYKHISETKLTKTNTLLGLYENIHTIELRISKSKRKRKNK